MVHNIEQQIVLLEEFNMKAEGAKRVSNLHCFLLDCWDLVLAFRLNDDEVSRTKLSELLHQVLYKLFAGFLDVPP